MALSSSRSLPVHNNSGNEQLNETPYPSDLPGSLAFTNPVVANMMRLWNYKEGSGLGAHGQGIIAPIQPTVLKPNAGIGHRKKPYDNGLYVSPPCSTYDELEELIEWSRSLDLEEECCEKTLELLRDKITREGDDSAETAAALAAVVESKKVFQMLRENRKIGMWKSAMPSSTSRYIVERMVVPAMTVDLESWMPSWDPECYHWLRPWIPLIDHLPEDMYDAVEAKIKDCDYKTISPWKKYLSPVQWDIFTEQHILPRLIDAVRKLRITPPKQIDTLFRWVMEWTPIVHVQTVAQILEDERFFDKWESALRHWLLSMKPSSGEALAWCTGWKNLFTPELLADERVLARLDAGVAMVYNEV